MKKYSEEEIDDYVLNRMEASKRQEFTATLEANQELHKRVSLKKQFIRIARMKKEIKEFHKAESTNRRSIIKPINTSVISEPVVKTTPTETGTIVVLKPVWKNYGLIAAGIALMLAIGLTWLINSRPDYNQEYANYFQKETIELDETLTRLGEVGMLDEDRIRKRSLYDGLDFYRQKIFQSSVTTLEKHLEQFPQDKTAQFYLGVSYMHQQDFLEAEKWLTPLTKSDNTWQIAAKWYLALNYLKIEGKEQLSKDLLNELVQNNTNYSKQASTLLNQL